MAFNAAPAIDDAVEGVDVVVVGPALDPVAC